MSGEAPGSSRKELSPFARTLVPPLAAGVIRLLRAGVRLRCHGREVVEDFAARGQRYIHVFWHAHLLLMVYSYVGPRLVFMISRHRDGEMIARTVERFGYVPARGSSSRGGAAALRGMLRHLDEGSDIGFTPDGPRGPARKVQPGCVIAARLGRVPIVPVAVGYDRAWRLDSWDRFMIPRPGSRGLMAYGQPLVVAPGEDLVVAGQRVEQALNRLEAFAAEHAADPGVGRPL